MQVNVTPSSGIKEQSKRKHMRGIQISHSLNTSSQSSQDDRYGTVSKSSRHSYSMKIDGRTRFGRTESSIQLDDQNGKRTLSSFRSKLQNRLGKIQAGDVSAEVSRLTLPYLGFQGMEWKTQGDGFFTADVLGGYLNKQFWGPAAFTAGMGETRFAAFKGGVRPSKNVELFVLGSKLLDRTQDERSGNRGFGGSIKRGESLVNWEAADSERGKAWTVDIETHKGPAYLAITQRSVDANYNTAAGSGWEQGRAGQSAQAGMKDWNFVSALDVRYDQFRAYYRPSKSQPYALNREWRLKADLQFSSNLAEQSYLSQDFPGVAGPTQLSQYKLKISNTGGSFRPYVGARRETGLYPESRLRDYSDSAVSYGFIYAPVKSWTNSFSAETVMSRHLSSGNERVWFSYSAASRWYGKSFSAFSHRVSAEYQNTMARYSERAHSLLAHIRNDYSLGKDSSIYLMGQFQRNFITASQGSAFSFFSGVEWTNGLDILQYSRRRIKGSVFMDLNGDGVRQQGEKGLEGISVILNDRQMARTGHDGEFSFKPSRGNLMVRLDNSSLPRNSRLSTSNPQVFSEADDSGEVQSNFGIAYLGAVSGAVLIDINGNGLRDSGDMPLRGAVISFDGNQFQKTDALGQFQFAGASAGEHEVALDAMTLPQDFSAVSAAKVRCGLSEGEKKELYFLVRPVHVVSGIVFYDKNGNRELDAGEKGLAGITVDVVGRAAVSDDDGYYYIGQFGGGKWEMEFPAQEFSRRWVPAQSSAMVLEVEADRPFVKRNLNIPMRQSR